MSVCSRLVSSVVFLRLYFVRLASLVSTLIMMMSLFLYVVCFTNWRVCGRVYVGCKVTWYAVLLLLLLSSLLSLMILSTVFLNISAVNFPKLLS